MPGVGADQLALLRALKRHGVEFVVIGGVAAQLHGWREATVDLDITIDLSGDNLARLDVALVSVHARNIIQGATGSTMLTDHGRLEILSSTDGPRNYAEWRQGASEHSVESGLVIAVADQADIVRSKQAAGRDKDLAVIPRMVEAFRDADATDAAASEPSPFEALLGVRPRRAQHAAIWDTAAEQIAEFRRRWNIAGAGLDPATSDAEHAADRKNLEQAIARVHRILRRRR